MFFIKRFPGELTCQKLGPVKVVKAVPNAYNVVMWNI